MSFSFFVIKNEKSWTKSEVLYPGCDLWTQRNKAAPAQCEHFEHMCICWEEYTRLAFWILTGSKAKNTAGDPNVPITLTPTGLYDFRLLLGSD